MSFNVTSYADLKKVGTGADGWNLDSDYVQTANIDASASATENPDGEGGFYGFEPIGTFANKFTGTYDGGRYTISNLYINRTSTDYVGLFGYVDTDAGITNLGVTNCDITGDDEVGGIIGYNFGTISNCYVTGAVSGGINGIFIGGFVGKNDGGISNCYSTSSVSGYLHIGGFVGYNHEAIFNCYSTGAVTGDYCVGGFVGYNFGDLTSDDYTYCYYDTETSGMSDSNGGVGLTTDEMTEPYGDNAYVGWNFASIWHADVMGSNSGYPVLMDFLDYYVKTISSLSVESDSANLVGKVGL